MDQVAEEYTSSYGLHVMHITRQHCMPDVDAWQQAYPDAHGTIYVDEQGTGHLWLWSKKHAKS